MKKSLKESSCYSAEDAKFMQMAIDLSIENIDTGGGPFGAVIVRNGEVIATGANRVVPNADPTAHAEVAAIREAAKALGDWRLSDCTLYVTLEPCAMCAGTIINARVGRVVYGASEPLTGAVGSVCNLFAMPFSHCPALTVGVLEEQCRMLIKDFFAQRK